MKQLYLLLALLWLAAPTRANQPDSVRLRLNHVFAPLDKTQVPTGYLEEFGPALAPLDVFGGALTDSGRTSPAIFRLAYATVRQARIVGSSPLPTLPAPKPPKPPRPAPFRCWCSA